MSGYAARWKLSPSGERIVWSDIKDRIDLARVVEGMLGPPAKQSGRRLLWLCPFHDDGHPSLEVDPERKTWKCWPCNLGGDAPALVMKLDRVGFPEAVRIVAELAGIVAPSGMRWRAPAKYPTVAKPGKNASKPPERSSGLPLEEACSLVTEAAKRLWKPEGRQALDYLHGRCLKDETIRAARLGVVGPISIPTREGDRCFIARGVVIPSFDGDRLALVKIRQPEGTKPKYIDAFRDRPGIFPGPTVIEPGRVLIITEGHFDALLLGQELRDLAAVVTLGPASNRPDAETRARMLAAPVWFVAHDADEAGDKGASKWPARARRIRPPDPFNDWTEAAQGGVNLRCWWLPRLGGPEALWHELAGWRWGSARSESGPSATEHRVSEQEDR
jgi:hypothetical protein